MTVEEIIKLADSGANILITGAGGVGKTYNTNALLKHFDEKGTQYAMTATTGIASTQYEDAGTIHRCAGLGIYTKLDNIGDIVTDRKWAKDIFPRIRQLDVLLIDEISMMRPDTFELLDHVCREGKHKHLIPFGGVQIIMIGDFLQLPPVFKNWEDKVHTWVFQTDTWKNLNVQTVLLTEIKRQVDEKFIMGLRRVRAGMLDHATNVYFASTSKREFPEGVEPVRIMATNAECEGYNAHRLNALGGEYFSSQAIVTAVEPIYEKQLRKECLAMDFLELKVGAQVMIIKNDRDGQYVNGTMGIYRGRTTIMKDDWEEGDEIEREVVGSGLSIEIIGSGNLVTIDLAVWSIKDPTSPKDDPTFLASFTQYPIKLAWSITAHKSQGLTLDYVEINLQNFFAEGQAYVALSRARSYEGLKILGWNPKNVKANFAAFDFYNNLAKPQSQLTNQNQQ